MMDDPNITMEEYIKHQAEKAQRRDFKAYFLAIIYNDALASNENVSPKPIIQLAYHLKLRGICGLDFVGLTKEMRQDLTDKLRMVHTRAEGQVLFTSNAWRRLFEIQGALVREFMLEFFSTCRIDDTKIGLDTADNLCFQLGGARRSMT
ncbi:hypothetical protein Tco_0401519 [Tanacetum coccineum]